jgi:hypothetical protein
VSESARAPRRARYFLTLIVNFLAFLFPAASVTVSLTLAFTFLRVVRLRRASLTRRRSFLENRSLSLTRWPRASDFLTRFSRKRLEAEAVPAFGTLREPLASAVQLSEGHSATTTMPFCFRPLCGLLALSSAVTLVSSGGRTGPGAKGIASTVNERLAGDASVLPAQSVARTWKLCAPSASEAVVRGEPQAANEPESTLHEKVEAGSFDEKPSVGVGSLVVPDGPELIVVCGGVVSAR